MGGWVALIDSISNAEHQVVGVSVCVCDRKNGADCRLRDGGDRAHGARPKYLSQVAWSV